MVIIQNNFSKELSKILKKYKKTIISDKEGIYIIDSNKTKVFIKKSTSTTQNRNDALIFI